MKRPEYNQGMNFNKGLSEKDSLFFILLIDAWIAIHEP